MGDVVDSVGDAVGNVMGLNRSAPGAPNLGYDAEEVKKLKAERKAILEKMAGATPVRDNDGNIVSYEGDTYESRALNRAITGDDLLKDSNQLLQRQLGMLPKMDANGRPIISVDPKTGEPNLAPNYGDLMGRNEQLGDNLQNLAVGKDSPVQQLVNEAKGEQGYGGMIKALTGEGGVTDQRKAYENMFTGDNSFSSEAQAIANTQNQTMQTATGDVASLRGELRDTGSQIRDARSSLIGEGGTRDKIAGLEAESQSARNALQSIGDKFGNLEQDIRGAGSQDLTGFYAGELEAQRSASNQAQEDKMRRALAQGGGDLKDLARMEGQRAKEGQQQARADLLTASNQARQEEASLESQDINKAAQISNLYSKQQGAEQARAQILDQMLGQYQAAQGTTMQGAALSGQEAQLLQQQANMRQNEASMAMQGQNAQQQALQQRAQFAQTGAGMLGQNEATQMNAANLYGQKLNQQYQGINAQRQAMLDKNAMNNQQLAALQNQNQLLQQGQGNYMNQLSGQSQIQNLENAAGNYASMPLQSIQGSLDEQTQARLGQANLQYQSDMAAYNAPSMFDKAVAGAGAVGKIMSGYGAITS